MSAKKHNGNGLDGLARRVGLGIRNSELVVRGVGGVHRVGGTILRYHSVNDDPSWSWEYMQESLVVAPELFERQVAFLTKRFRIVSMTEMVRQMRSREGVDPRSVAITFDDGYEDNYRCAFPILRKHGATAAFYVTTGTVADARLLWTVGLRRAIRSCGTSSISLSFLGERSIDISTDALKETTIKMITGIGKRCKVDELAKILAEVHREAGYDPERVPRSRRVMMNWDEIREMHAAGMTIGAHTNAHYNLPSIDTSDVAQEVVTSRRAIEEELQAPRRALRVPERADGPPLRRQGREDSRCGRVQFRGHIHGGAGVRQVLTVLHAAHGRGSQTQGPGQARRRYAVLPVQAPGPARGGRDNEGSSNSHAQSGGWQLAPSELGHESQRNSEVGWTVSTLIGMGLPRSSCFGPARSRRQAHSAFWSSF